MEISANISHLFLEVPLLERPKAAKILEFKSVDVASPFDASPSDWQTALQQARSALNSFDLPMGDFFEGGEGLLCDPKQEAAFQSAFERSMEYVEVLKVDSINLYAGRSLQTPPGKAWIRSTPRN